MKTEIKNNNYRNALVEVEAVLELLEYEDYNKIPSNIIKAISENKNSEYVYEYDEDLDFEYWTILPETKAILYNLFRDYLATDEQKEFIIKKENVERLKLEQEKAKNYNPNDIFKDKKNYSMEETEKDLKTANQETSKSLIKYKENIFVRIINKIKNIFRR